MESKSNKAESSMRLVIPEEYQPIHDFKWAAIKAMDGEHCVCDEIIFEQLRLVYALDKLTLRRYNRYGITVQTLEPTWEAMNSKTWRLWD